MPKPKPSKSLHVVAGTAPGTIVASWNFAAKSISRDGQDASQAAHGGIGWTGYSPTSPFTLQYLLPGSSYTVTVTPADGSKPLTGTAVVAGVAPTPPPPAPVPPPPAPIPAPPPTPTPTPAPVPTSGYRAVSGVCTHLGYDGYPSSFSANAQFLHDTFVDLGVAHLRDGFGWDRDALVSWLLGLHSTLGTMLTLVLDPRDGADIPRRLDAYRSLTRAGAVAAIEGPNEWDAARFSVNGWTITDSNWVSQLRLWTGEMVAALRADADFAHIPIAAPSLAQTMDPTPYHAVGFIDGLDLGNSHAYQGDSVYANGQIKSTADLDTAFTSIARTAIANAQIIAGAGKPVICTETGVTAGGGYPGVSEAAQAQINPLVLQVYAREGFARTFIYSLIAHPDLSVDAHESGFGMIRFDLSHRPVFAAVKTLLAA